MKKKYAGFFFFLFVFFFLQQQRAHCSRETKTAGGAFSRDIIIHLALQCRAFSRALKTEK